MSRPLRFEDLPLREQKRASTLPPDAILSTCHAQLALLWAGARGAHEEATP